MATCDGIVSQRCVVQDKTNNSLKSKHDSHSPVQSNLETVGSTFNGINYWCSLEEPSFSALKQIIEYEDQLSASGKSGSISDFLAYSSDVSSICDGTVKSVCSDDEMNINIVTGSGESGKNDIVFDMCSRDGNEDENANYFSNTHYNCIPVWEMEWQQYQQDEVTQNNNQVMVEDDPCTINVLKDSFKNKNYGAHSVPFIQSQLDSEANGTNGLSNKVFSNKLPCDVEDDTSVDKLELEILDGVFIPSTFNTVKDPVCNFCQTALFDAAIEQNNNNNMESPDYIVVAETICKLPPDFYPLKDVLIDIVDLDQQFGDQIGILVSSLDQLELIFVGKDKCEFVYRKFTMNEDFENGSVSPEFYPLKLLLGIFEDLEIEYGDRIGIHQSFYDNLKFIFLHDIDKLLVHGDIYTRSLNFNDNVQQWNQKEKCFPNYKNYKKKRGKKKKRYKWIVKGKLQHPVSKIFGKNDNIGNSISNISITSSSHTDSESIMNNSSDYSNGDTIDSRVLSDEINISNSESEYGSPLGSIKIVTARAPPCDPDGKY